MAIAKWIETLLAVLLLALVLWWPTGQSEGQLSAIAVIAGVVGSVLLLSGFTLTVRGGLAVSIVWPLLVIALLVRFLHYGLVQFHGAGFSEQFFFHLSLESARIAWHEYSQLIRNFALLLFVVLLFVGLLAFRGIKLGMRAGGILMIGGLVLIVVGRQGMPEWDLISKVWMYWHPAPPVAVTDEELQRWQATGLVETNLVSKKDIQASTSGEPKNLILVYLEGMGVSLTEHPDWPGLTPNLRALLKKNQLVDNVYASAYITMEGVANTQCGTLFPFFRWGHDSLAGGDGLAEDMACLGDILKSANYRQTFLGGATMSFTGKGDFLAAHGYDNLLGWEYWESNEFERGTDPWGLSDPDLFKQALKEIRDLRQEGDPWSMTLITLGTHVPGYFYEGCKRYGHSDSVENAEAREFLDAMHCTDQLLGEWLKKIEQEGVLDDTVVLITADHQIVANPATVELFGDAVMDNRVPFIVIGDDIPTPSVRHGAGYDLAPTVLDLLTIKHNVRFPLGQSLLRRTSEQNYIFSIEMDYDDGVFVKNKQADCERSDGSESSLTPEFPLNPCEKKDLFAVLGFLVDSYSENLPLSVSCDITEPIHVKVPYSEGDLPLEIRIGSQDIADRFSAFGNIVSPSLPGLYAVALSEQGDILLRHYFHPDDEPDQYASRLFRLFKRDGSAIRALLLVWQPGLENPGVIKLPVLGVLDGDKSGIWLLDMDARVIIDSVVNSNDSDISYRMDTEQCRKFF